MAVKIVTYTTTTDPITGVGTIDLTLPGTYGGINPMSSTWSGRQLIKLAAWLEARAPGDKISSFISNDTDGVLSAPERALFPSYPILGSLNDSNVSAGNQGITLPINDIFHIDFPASNRSRFASQIHIIITVTKAIPALDTFTVNIAWDDGL